MQDTFVYAREWVDFRQSNDDYEPYGLAVCPGDPEYALLHPFKPLPRQRQELRLRDNVTAVTE
jgi:hypothetical protein